MVRKELREIAVHYCDGCNRELKNEIIYGYKSGVELGSCCHRELAAFEFYKMRARYAVSEIKSQPFY